MPEDNDSNSCRCLHIFRCFVQLFRFCGACSSTDETNRRTESFLGSFKETCFKTCNKQTGECKIIYTFEKHPLKSHYWKGFIPFQKLYSREIYMYRAVIPNLLEFQKDTHRLFTSFATFLNTMEDNERILMEDMTKPPHNFTHMESQNPLDYTHLMFAAQQYGKFHALSFAYQHRKPAQFAAMITNLEENYYHSINDAFLFRFGFAHVCDLLESYMSQADQNIMPLFKALKVKMFEAVLKITESSYSKYNVICHGDANLSNLFFKYGNRKIITLPKMDRPAPKTESVPPPKPESPLPPIIEQPPSPNKDESPLPIADQSPNKNQLSLPNEDQSSLPNEDQSPLPKEEKSPLPQKEPSPVFTRKDKTSPATAHKIKSSAAAALRAKAAEEAAAKRESYDEIKEEPKEESPTATTSSGLIFGPPTYGSSTSSSSLEYLPPIYEFSDEKFERYQREFREYSGTPTLDEEDYDIPEPPPPPRQRFVSHDIVPIEMCMLDLQMAFYGSPALDLVSLLFTSATSEFRKEHGSQFLTVYYANLRDSLSLYGLKAQDIYSYSTLGFQVKQMALFGVFKAMLTLYFKTSKPSDVPDFTKVENDNQVIQKHNYKNSNIEKYRARITNLMREYLTMGYWLAG